MFSLGFGSLCTLAAPWKVGMSVVATVTDSVWSSVDLSGWQGIVRKLEFRRLLAESVKTPDRLVYDCEFTQQSEPI